MEAKRNLIIAGVHKAGTSSLFTYLASHSAVFGSPIKEIHYYTPLKYMLEKKPLSYYDSCFKKATSEQFLLDASPSYLYGKERVTSVLFEELKNPKVIIVLRNPVDRFISYYRHLTSKLFLKDCELEEFFIKAKEDFDESDLIKKDNYFDKALKEGLYDWYLEPWLEKGKKNVKIVFFDDLKNKPQSLMFELSDWLEIPKTDFEIMEFSVENKTRYSKNETIHQVAMAINKYFEAFLRNNYQIKKVLRFWYFKLNEQKKSLTLQNELGSELENFYEPSIKRLKKKLTDYGYENLPKWLD